MTALLWYGVPILLGFVCGYFLSLPVNIGLTVIVAGIAGSLLWQTRNAELGAFVGIIAAMVSAVGLASLWITIGIVNGVSYHVDLSWLLRGSP